MFKKLLVANAILALTTGVAFAKDYKGEHTSYKGEAPCPVVGYNPVVAPYVGLGVGVRTNWAGSSRVFQGLNGALSLGYGGMVDPLWYLAGEIFVDGTIKLKDYETSLLSVRSTWDYGVSILPGFKVNDDVLGFLRLGAIRTRWNEQGTSSTGGQVGVGAQTGLTPNWDVRAEYDYTYYANTSNVGHPQSNVINLAFLYRIV